MLGLAWYSDVLIAAAGIATIGGAITYLTKWGTGLLHLARRWRRVPNSIAGAEHELQEDVLYEAAPLDDDQALTLLRRAGMANSLVGRYQVSAFAPPLPHDDAGAVIRVVVGAAYPPEGAKFDTRVKTMLREALQRSSLERWLSDQTLADETPTWTKESP